MTTVTATVSACLASIGVHPERYNNIQNGKPFPTLTVCPDDDELRQLCSGKAIWSTMGLQLAHDDSSELVTSLHQYDFVCLKPNNGNKLYDIAQIQTISMHAGQIRIAVADFKRAKGDRMLGPLGTTYILEDNRRVEQVCWVGEFGKDEGDFRTQTSLKYCRECLQKRLEKTEAASKLYRLRVLSLFGGAGGMDIGLSFSHFRTNWMVDLDPASCSTFSAHHPAASVVQDTVGHALDHRTMLPEVGEVDVIAMGPPCQPFSRVNRQTSEEREQDPRSLCVATGLSYVEIYKPTYGIIENVCGFLDNGDLGMIKKYGTIKFVLLCLATLGYKVRIGTVQCSGFGIPQSRQRVIILFAKDDVTLPQIPVETHYYSSKPALYANVTIHDATSDLPRWDVKNPSTFAPCNHQPEEKRKKVPPAFTMDRNGQVIGPQTCNYAMPPSNFFQEQMRRLQSDHVSSHHKLPPFESPLLTIERIWNIPLHPNANHLALQNLGLLSIPQLVETKEDTTFKNAFRRLDLKGIFPIVLTSVSLQSKGGRMLMPDQHRLPSIREFARAQGFPDGIQFQGTSSEIFRQIGNAVAPPLAFVIGENIKEAIILDFIHGDLRFVRRKKV